MTRDQKTHASDKEVPVAPSVVVSGAVSSTEPHPGMIQIVRLLARQTAMADIAAQQNTAPED